MIVDTRLRAPTSSFAKTMIFRQSYPPSAAERSLALCISEMEEAGIDRGVVMGRQSDERWGSVPNDEIGQLVKEYPGKFIGFGGIDIAGFDRRPAIAEIDRCINTLGLSGISIEPGISPRRQYPDDFGLFPIYERCAELGVPIAVNLSVAVADDMTYCNPTPVQHVARYFPQLNIIVSHGAYPWVELACAVALRCRNVYLSPDIYVHSRFPGHIGYVEAANSFLSDRVLFGSAYPLAGMREAVQGFRAAPFHPGVIDRVMGENAAKLFKLTNRS